MSYANTAMMNLFLAQISIEFPEYLIILQVDRSAWHRAKSLKVPENIRLLQQPPYTPQVMPVEHLWDEIREKHFDNRTFKSLNAVEDTLCEALKQLNEQPDSLRSMAFFPHLKVTL